MLITDGVTTECEAADSTCCGYLTPPPIGLRSIAQKQGLTGKVSCELGEPGVATPEAERDCNRLLIIWNTARSQCEYRRLAKDGASVVTVSVNSGAMTNSDITEKESLILLQRLTTPPKERNFISIPDVANMADSVITNLLQKTCKEDCIMDKRWSICEANSTEAIAQDPVAEENRNFTVVKEARFNGDCLRPKPEVRDCSLGEICSTMSPVNSIRFPNHPKLEFRSISSIIPDANSFLQDRTPQNFQNRCRKRWDWRRGVPTLVSARPSGPRRCEKANGFEILYDYDKTSKRTTTLKNKLSKKNSDVIGLISNVANRVGFLVTHGEHDDPAMAIAINKFTYHGDAIEHYDGQGRLLVEDDPNDCEGYESDPLSVCESTEDCYCEFDRATQSGQIRWRYSAGRGRRRSARAVSSARMVHGRDFPESTASEALYMLNNTGDDRYVDFVKLDFNVYRDGGYRLCSFACEDIGRSLREMRPDDGSSESSSSGGNDDSPFDNSKGTEAGSSGGTKGGKKGGSGNVNGDGAASSATDEGVKGEIVAVVVISMVLLCSMLGLVGFFVY